MPVLFSAGGTGIPAIPPKILFYIGSLPFTETMFSGLVTTGALILLALVVRIFFIPKWNKCYEKKSGFRIFIEYVVGIFKNTADDLTEGHNAGFISAWYFAAAAFICLGTLIELLGLRPPTSDLNMALAFGFTTFILINVFGFKEKKLKRLKRYLNPINIITDAVVPFSMSLRMFGSVLSGFLIMHLIYSLPWPVLIGFPAVGSVMFTLFHALIQSYVFMFLSMSFISEATE